MKKLTLLLVILALQARLVVAQQQAVFFVDSAERLLYFARDTINYFTGTRDEFIVLSEANEVSIEPQTKTDGLLTVVSRGMLARDSIFPDSTRILFFKTEKYWQQVAVLNKLTVGQAVFFFGNKEVGSTENRIDKIHIQIFDQGVLKETWLLKRMQDGTWKHTRTFVPQKQKTTSTKRWFFQLLFCSVLLFTVDERHALFFWFKECHCEWIGLAKLE